MGFVNIIVRKIKKNFYGMYLAKMIFFAGRDPERIL